MQDFTKRPGAKPDDDDGFTLIELLVVVVIIGVLVAIAVPVYLNYRQGAADKSAQSDVRGAISAIEQYYANNGNFYPATAASQTATFTLAAQTGGTAVTIPLSEKTTLTYYKIDASTYRICAKNDGGTTNRYYNYTSSTGGSVAPVTSGTFSLATCA
jgi:type IV pilus assembly protein PilA